MHDLIGKKVDKILADDVVIDAITDVDIGMAIVIGIEDQGPPTPIRSGDATEVSDLPKTQIVVVQLEGVLHILVVKALFLFELVKADVVEGSGGFEAVRIVGQHIGDEDFGEIIVVDVGHIGAHGGVADVGSPVFEFLGKSAIALVEVEVVTFEEIIGYVDVGIIVPIDVTERHPESKTDQATVAARRFADVDKFTPIVAEQFIPSPLEKVFAGPVPSAQFPLVAVIEGIDGDKAIVEQVNVEVAIEVKIRPAANGAVALQVKGIEEAGHIGEGFVAIVVEQEVPLGGVGGAVAARGNVLGQVEVDVAIVVVIAPASGHGARGQGDFQATAAGDVGKGRTPVVAEENVLFGIGQVNIGPAVVVEVCDGYPTPITTGIGGAQLGRYVGKGAVAIISVEQIALGAHRHVEVEVAVAVVIQPSGSTTKFDDIRSTAVVLYIDPRRRRYVRKALRVSREVAQQYGPNPQPGGMAILSGKCQVHVFVLFSGLTEYTARLKAGNR